MIDWTKPIESNLDGKPLTFICTTPPDRHGRTVLINQDGKHRMVMQDGRFMPHLVPSVRNVLPKVWIEHVGSYRGVHENCPFYVYYEGNLWGAKKIVTLAKFTAEHDAEQFCEKKRAELEVAYHKRLAKAKNSPAAGSEPWEARKK